MDVLKILRSVEELLYEVMSWLIFYPRTLWLTLTRPLRTMRYSDQEQASESENRYADTLSPPLFLVLSILLAHGIEILAHLKTPEARDGLGQMVVSSDQNLLAFRAVMFSLHPLAFAAAWLWLAGRSLDREKLRAPFFAQCYLAGATSILVSVGAAGVRYPSDVATAVGIALIAAITAWYLSVQRRWFMRIEGMTRWRAWGWVVATFVASTSLVIASAAALD